MSQYPLEGLLRPAVEAQSAFVAASCAVLTATCSDTLMMPQGFGLLASVGLIGFAVYRGKQAWRIMRYQRRLKKLPTFLMKANEIPISDQKLWLGMGFEWKAIHTQRLRECALTQNEIFVNPGKFYQWARKIENDAITNPQLASLAVLTSKNAWWNPVKPLPDVGGKSVTHGVGEDEEYIYQLLSERHGHTLVIGTTRVGKSRTLEVTSTQDIGRKDCTIIVDPKGDAGIMKRAKAEADRHGRQFYLFHLGYPEFSARYNAVGSFSRITEVATRMTDPLPSSGNSAAFKEFAWRLVNVIAKALNDMGQRPDFKKIGWYVYHIDDLFEQYVDYWLKRENPAGWEKFVEDRAFDINDKPKAVDKNLIGRSARSIALFEYITEKKIIDPVIDGLATTFRYEKSYADKLFSSLGPFLEKLISGKAGELLAPDYDNLDDERPVIDWLKIMRQGSVVYLGLDALSDSMVAGAVGNAMLSDIASAAGYLYKHGVDAGQAQERQKPLRVCMHFDELESILGDNFIPLVNRCGGAGMQITAYTQSGSDLEKKLGSRAAAQVVLDNFNSVIMLRVKSESTAKILTDQLPMVDVLTMTQVSGVSDSPDGGHSFTPNNQDRISMTRMAMLEPNDVITLPKGQCFAFINGGQLYKLRLPLLDEVDDAYLPKNLQMMADSMRKNYRSGEAWWQESQHSVQQSEASWANLDAQYHDDGDFKQSIDGINT